jgi:branched-subunit amino acid aminotransferase/4-amino-4-deoxychorismate lyase
MWPFLLGGRWVTPPLRCGLLAGVGRARALQDGRIHEEAVVRVDDLPRVEALAFVNSLRGWISAELAGIETKTEQAVLVLPPLPLGEGWGEGQQR